MSPVIGTSLDLIDEYPKLLLGRSVEGIIAVDTPWKNTLPVPVVTVSGHNEVSGVTNVEIDHNMAAELALRHLVQLGHRKFAFIKGQQFSSDTELRWNAIVRNAQKLGLTIVPELVMQLVGDKASPELGYKVARKADRDTQAVYSVIYLQRYFRHRCYACLARGWAARPNGCFGGWI